MSRPSSVLVNEHLIALSRSTASILGAWQLPQTTNKQQQKQLDGLLRSEERFWDCAVKMW